MTIETKYGNIEVDNFIKYDKVDDDNIFLYKMLKDEEYRVDKISYRLFGNTKKMNSILMVSDECIFNKTANEYVRYTI